MVYARSELGSQRVNGVTTRTALKHPIHIMCPPSASILLAHEYSDIDRQCSDLPQYVQPSAANPAIPRQSLAVLPSGVASE